MHRIVNVKEANLGAGDLLFQKPIALVLQRVIRAGLKNLKNEENFESGGLRDHSSYISLFTFTIVPLIEKKIENIAEKLEL